MFICSIKMSRKKLALAGAAILLAVLIGVGFAFAKKNAPDRPGGDDAARLAFLSSFGWTAAASPEESVQVAIPAEFDQIYENYNALQFSQGFDLTPYRGQTVERYTYQVLNYPDQPEMRASLLICNGRIIGGDLHLPQLDGFMCNFKGEPVS